MSAMNAFDLLGGEEGAELSIEELAKQAAASKPAAVKPVEEKPQGARPTSAAGGRGSGRGDVAARGNGRGAGRGAGGRGRGAPRGDDSLAFDAETAPSYGRGGRGGRGRGRGGRGAGGRGKREYDRHDGTGRGHETEKRHGQGAHNWGAETEEVAEDLEKMAVEGGEEAPAAVAAEGAAAPAAETEAPAVEAEPEEVQMTLEEYEAILAEKRAGLNAQREAAFKPDAKQFEGFKQMTKAEEDAEDIGLGLNKNVKVIGANKAGREKERKEKELLTPNFKIQSGEEAGAFRPGGRGGRSGRGRGVGGREGGRGGRGFAGRGASGRGGPRSEGSRGTGRGSAPTLDSSAFPELSAQA